MPMHDWSRVDASVYHDFHQAWTMRLCDRLNAGLLPKHYSALVEPKSRRPQFNLLHNGSTRHVRRATGIGGATQLPPPRTSFVFEPQADSQANRANRIAIRYRLDELVSSTIVVSPENKRTAGALHNFVAKTKEFLDAGVNVLIVDPFPPTPRDPGGIHKAVWDEVQGEEPFELPADRPLTLAAYVAGDLSVGEPIRAYVETFAVGRAMKDMPAYLDADYHVPVPLEATYMAAWRTCPADMRYLVEHGKLPDE